MSKIGFVTVLFNSDSVLEGIFESLSLQNNQNFIVYMIDNSYSKESEIFINSLVVKFNLQNQIKHIINASNEGVAKGNNQGIELAVKDGCDYILIGNNDIEFYQKDLFDVLAEKCEVNKIVAPKVLYYNTNQIWFAGGHIDKYRALAIHENEYAESIDEEERFTEYAPTCFVLFHKEVFEKVGLMDEKYFVYWDDTDFILRATNFGYKILFLPSYIIQHKVSISTGGRASLFSTFYFLRNRLYFIRKHFKGLSFVSSLCYTYLTSFVKIILYDMKRKKVIFKAIRDANLM
jgi:GT2 family glycosyltransferase